MTRTAKFVNTCTTLPKSAGVYDHIGGIYSYNGMIDYPRFPISELHLGNFLTLWNLIAGKSTSRLKYVRNQQSLI